MKQWLVAVLAAFTLMSAPISAETFYKWQDDAGVTHYGNEPPVGVDAVPVSTTRSAPVKPAADNTPEAVESEAAEEFDERLQEAEKQRKSEMAAACQSARDARISLEAKHRIRLKQPDGSYKMLSHEEKMAEIAKIDEQIKEYCNP